MLHDSESQMSLVCRGVSVGLASRPRPQVGWWRVWRVEVTMSAQENVPHTRTRSLASAPCKVRPYQFKATTLCAITHLLLHHSFTFVLFYNARRFGFPLPHTSRHQPQRGGKLASAALKLLLCTNTLAYTHTHTHPALAHQVVCAAYRLCLSIPKCYVVPDCLLLH